MIEMAQQRLNLSARAYHRVLRVARTIADLAQSEVIQKSSSTEALSYRGNHFKIKQRILSPLFFY